MLEYEVGARLQRQDLHKLHGLENDFLIWFQPEVPADSALRAKLWCNRRSGIGADGLIIAVDDRSRPSFTLFNADGSAAEISGNGLRCFAHAVAARRGLDELDLVIDTAAGQRSAKVSGALKMVATATINMGEPKPGPDPMGLDLTSILEFKTAMTVDLGNPHIVIVVDDITVVDTEKMGRAVEAAFKPEGINVEFVEINDDQVRLKVFERGAGVTSACGSGASAAAVVAYKMNRDITNYVVHMAGGSVRVDIASNIYLTGPSTYIAAITIPEAG